MIIYCLFFSHSLAPSFSYHFEISSLKLFFHSKSLSISVISLTSHSPIGPRDVSPLQCAFTHSFSSLFDFGFGRSDMVFTTKRERQVPTPFPPPPPPNLLSSTSLASRSGLRTSRAKPARDPAASPFQRRLLLSIARVLPLKLYSEAALRCLCVCACACGETKREGKKRKR